MYYINPFFQSQSFLIKTYDILKTNIFTCSCWATVENGLLCSGASGSSLLYSGLGYMLCSENTTKMNNKIINFIK